ncbi:MAG TPA: M12 family metallopeptidase [Thermoanaerobaculia bacterium]|nr:M12 family metallopeptidase [Thermoanaerobaculia bacterium]
MRRTLLSASILLAALVATAADARLRPAAPQGKPKQEAAEEYGASAPAGQRGSLEIRTPEGRRKVGYTVYDGIAVAEGDIILGPVDEAPTLAGRTALASRWFCAVIPFTIDPTMPNPARVTGALAQWQASADVRFVPRTTQSDYVTYRRVAKGCSSPSGRQGGQQFVNVADTCSMGNVMHETGHVLGLWHEQSRTDRDRFVTIVWANVQDDKKDDFAKYRDLGNDGADIGPYDFGSIMHYPANAFSKGGNTILAAGGAAIGQRVAPSLGDVAGLREMYPQLKQETFCRGIACGPFHDLCGRDWNCAPPTEGEACGFLHCGEEITDMCGTRYTCGAAPTNDEFCATHCDDGTDECGNHHSCPDCIPPPPDCNPPNQLCCDGTCGRVCGVCPP